jgi:hypothetical protein
MFVYELYCANHENYVRNEHQIVSSTISSVFFHNNNSNNNNDNNKGDNLDIQTAPENENIKEISSQNLSTSWNNLNSPNVHFNTQAETLFDSVVKTNGPVNKSAVMLKKKNSFKRLVIYACMYVCMYVCICTYVINLYLKFYLLVLCEHS